MNDTPPTPSPRQRGAVVLRGRHDLGEIVGYAYRLYARHAPMLFAIALLTVPVRLLQGVIEDRISSDEAKAAISLLQVPEAFIGLIASAAIVFAVHDASGGMKPEFGRSLDAALAKIGALFTTTILGGLLAVAAAFAAPVLALYWLFNKNATIGGHRNWWLALVPGALAVYLVVRWVFVPQTVMIEDARNWAALDSSAATVRGSWWRSFGILLVIGIIQAGPIIMASASSLLPALAEAAITSLAFAIVLPFYSAAQTLLYYDLKSRKEPDVSIDRLAAAEPDVPG